MKSDGVAEVKIAISQEVPRLNFPLVVEKPLHGSWMKNHYFFSLGLRFFFFDTKNHWLRIVVRFFLFFSRWLPNIRIVRSADGYVLWAEAEAPQRE